MVGISHGMTSNEGAASSALPPSARGRGELAIQHPQYMIHH